MNPAKEHIVTTSASPLSMRSHSHARYSIGYLMEKDDVGRSGTALCCLVLQLLPHRHLLQRAANENIVPEKKGLRGSFYSGCFSVRAGHRVRAAMFSVRSHFERASSSGYHLMAETEKLTLKETTGEPHFVVSVKPVVLQLLPHIHCE